MAISQRDYFLPHKVQANYLWRQPLVKVALDGIPHRLMKVARVIGFRKDRLPQGARRITAFRSLVYKKN